MPKRNKRFEDEIPNFSLQVFRENLAQLRQNLFGGRILRGRFFQPTIQNEPQYEEPQPTTVKAKPTLEGEVEIVEETDATGKIWRTFYDKRTGKKLKTEILESEDAKNLESTTSEPLPINVAYEKPQPILNLKILRERPILDSIRKVFKESSRQIELKTKVEELRLEALKQQLQQKAKPKKSEEEEQRGLHY